MFGTHRCQCQMFTVSDVNDSCQATVCDVTAIKPQLYSGGKASQQRDRTLDGSDAVWYLPLTSRLMAPPIKPVTRWKRSSWKWRPAYRQQRACVTRASGNDWQVVKPWRCDLRVPHASSCNVWMWHANFTLSRNYNDYWISIRCCVKLLSYGRT